MDSSSTSASSSSPHYKGASVPFPASSRPTWPDLPIYDSTPHYPPPNYAYDYTGGGSAAEKKDEDEESAMAMAVAVEREHMFDKVVTPSDVGKLNRLVIPKQHAEKYFPLDSSTGDSKGLLLNFVDRSGKPWRFRYSYWNSSQSYVMTKGWSRFVKDKKLDAGDIVSFHRGADEKDRFYIDWRRRPDAPPYHHHHALYHHGVQFPHGFALHRPMNNIPPQPFYNSNYNLSPPLPPPAREQHWGSVVGYNGLTTSNASTDGGYRGNYGMVSPNFCHHSGSVIYLGAAAAASAASVAPQQQMLGEGGRISDHKIMIGGDGGGAVAQAQQMVFDSVPVVHGGKTVPKRLRLFGVNMDYTDSQEEFEQKQQNHHHLHDFVLDSDQISSSSSGAESELQLRLRSGSAVGVDKGKPSSSMSLDLDI